MASGVASAFGAAASASRTAAPMTAPVNLAATRGDSRTQVMTASTGTTAHAVDFIAHATASTSRRADELVPGPARASARQVSAMIGGSVTPTVSGKAMSGEATEIAVSTPPAGPAADPPGQCSRP